MVRPQSDNTVPLRLSGGGAKPRRRNLKPSRWEDQRGWLPLLLLPAADGVTKT